VLHTMLLPIMVVVVVQLNMGQSILLVVEENLWDGHV